MIYKAALAVIIAIGSTSAFALTNSEQQQVNRIIQNFKQNNQRAIIQNIRYPL